MVNKIVIHSELCRKMHQLYERKNADYGDSFSQLRHRYPNFVCMRIFDKLNRLETIMQPGYECKVSDETVEDTLMDIANYAIMEITERRAEKLKQAESMDDQENEDDIIPPNELSRRLEFLKRKLNNMDDYGGDQND